MNVPQPASASSRLVSGDDHVAPCRRYGVIREGAVASIVVVAEPPPFQAERKMSSCQLRLILLRGVACHVIRPPKIRSRVSLKACLVVSKSTVQAFGLPALRLTHMPGTELSVAMWRYEV